MKDLVIRIAQALVDHPEQVEVRSFGGGDRIRLELSVAKEDMGRIIGKEGRTAKAIRKMQYPLLIELLSPILSTQKPGSTKP